MNATNAQASEKVQITQSELDQHRLARDVIQKRKEADKKAKPAPVTGLGMK